MLLVPTLEDIRNAILRDYQSLEPNADISEDSDNFARASALSAVAEGLYAHQKWIIKQFFPDTADTEFLEKHASL
ncbi:baseplate J protein, partial [Pasteurella multocida]